MTLLRIPLKFNNAELQTLLGVLISAYNTDIKAQQLTDRVGLAAGTYPKADNMLETWTELLKVLAKQGKLRALVEEARDDPTVANYKETFARALELDTPLPTEQPLDLFELMELNQSRPFINRKKVRDYLRELDSPGGKRFLLINGPPGVGKTYCFYLVETLADWLPLPFEYCFIDLALKTPSSFGVNKLAEKIAVDLKLPATREMPAKLAVESKWAEEVGDWLLERLQIKNGRCWILLDGFANKELPLATRSLVRQILFATDKDFNHLRIVLIDFPHSALPLDIRFVANQVRLSELTREQVKTYLIKRMQEKQAEPDNAHVQQLVNKVMTQTEEEKEDLSLLTDENEIRRLRMTYIMARSMGVAAGIFGDRLNE